MGFLIAIQPFDIDDEDAAGRKRRARENESQDGDSVRVRTYYNATDRENIYSV